MILYISTGDGVLGYDAVQGVPKKRVPYNTCSVQPLKVDTPLKSIPCLFRSVSCRKIAFRHVSLENFFTVILSSFANENERKSVPRRQVLYQKFIHMPFFSISTITFCTSG